MNKLTELINSLNKQEARNFKIFEKRIGANKFEKKLLKLYDYIRTGKHDEYDEKLTAKLYSSDNKNAYYRLKNRLINNIQKSLIEFHLGVDKRMGVLGTIMLARIFYYKANYKLSFHYLESAEKQALEARTFNLFNLIYDEIINLSKYYFEIDPQYYINLKQERNQEYAQMQQMDYLLATMNYKLHKTNFSERGNDMLEELESLEKEFELLPENQNDAAKIEIHRVVRNILIQKKSFGQLEVYLLESYRKFREDKLFTKENHREKIILLTWIINTYHKNRKFSESLERLEELSAALQDYNKLYYDKYIWTYYQALITNYSSTRQNEKAIALLEEFKQEHKEEDTIFFGSFTHLPLISLYFNIKDYSSATRNLNDILHTSRYQSLSPQLRLYLGMTEVVLRVEMQDLNYALSRIKALKRSHRAILKKEEYQQEKAFIAILNAIVTKPGAFRRDNVRQKITDFLVNASQEVGSNSPIDYIAWITSKIEDRDYYDVLLDMNERVEE